ncbi:HU family DNA-binding protein [Parabacteroides sp. AM08-6]|uniref:HU family DNA-binding protein n=1 Tax=Parabacteroides sp. AM08-6 TaxID=2292053 RepID=UPI000F007875|nr:HU family DNA-binding protein [Parabacteroides sp. AM08-6]RHJ81894.1 hypothetical protein DW103_10505 [Parabacteroides sp. AM08-6]
MSQGYKLVIRKVSDLKGGAAKEKVYAIPSYNGYMYIDELCELIEMRSAMSSADVKSILDNLNCVVAMALKAGRIIQVGELGNFRLSMSSTGSETKDAFTRSDIKKARVLFSPGSALKNLGSIVNFVSAEKKDPAKPEGDNTGGDENPDIL